MPEVTLVAKRFTLVKRLKPRSPNNAALFYSKRFASCYIPRSTATVLGFRGCSRGWTRRARNEGR